MREYDEMTLDEKSHALENLKIQSMGNGLNTHDGEISLSSSEPDEGDYDNPIFKLQDELHECDMDSLGMSWNMFY